MKYQLNSNVRIVQFDDTFCFRKGLWDFNEAVLDIAQEPQALKEAYYSIISDWFNGKAIDTDTYEKTLESDLFAKLSEVITALYYNDLLMLEDAYALEENIMKVLTGNYHFIAESGQAKDTAPVLFISDSSYVNESAELLAKHLNLNLQVASDELKMLIQETDVTSRLDALEHHRNMKCLSEKLADYQSIVICQGRLNIMMLRHLNEISVALKKQMVLGFVDGPFIHACTLNPPHSADFDSLERRVLARLQDHTLYQRFASQQLPPTQPVSSSYVPLLNVLMNLVVSEAFIIAQTGSSKFEGRLLSVYLPTLEIQVQDILKMSNSQTQGALAKLRYEDQQISTREIVKKLLQEES
ncbi:TPA: streptolysin associated protein SagC [Streptococcus equi subsp. zooepidemicus]|uniref:streptolysin associated protein SagC n=1 Tax=Streptococcus equi TaxID=1336 RepID=UPI0005B78147|nr:streptolysin associated protein SagC [Streptococcus equi]KIS14329.1 Streptolysin S biosynthesis protein [Streptococcus equi subsp. zooepidemicus Sz105]KIS09248.1 Streptolysin S biosynthesis protein [Streptococcus equi subsp. zooepidemicus Sz5]MCD3375447.1 streptolysin associated protein SagC [Streptococcus equi subsp. zooepidemicus]MCD3414786.1 streptolysin associated protein SagC [Streptococcus equi subsp. zooepidemicus]MDI5988684.1 streptolysin associated protein SagC [Streptococcus equi 